MTPGRSPPPPVAIGAGASAPTAPHATPPGGAAQPTGPARFWSAPGRRLIVFVCVVASLGLHYALAPWSLLPEHDFEIRDTAGELAIPVDLLSGTEAPETPPPTPPPPPPADVPPKAVAKGEGLDAGAPHDAAPRSPRDAGSDAPRHKPVEAGVAVHRDAAPPDAGSGKQRDAAIARAGQVSGSARDAVGMIGAAGSAQAGPQNVVVTINMGVIRTHPVGSRLGPLFSALPQWDDFLAGTGVDPLRDTDWVSINGPSLIHSERDVILVHYSASDALVDRALDVVGRKAGNGGPYDAGVPGMKAVLGHADRADRVFMRPQAHVLAVVPPSYAATAARILGPAAIPRSPKRPAEAVRFTLIHPHGPMPAIPESVTELRLWIVPRAADGGADVYGEGDTAASEAARSAVDTLKSVVAEQNSFGVKLVTHGLLDNLALSADGSLVKLHLPVARDQLEVLLAFAAGRLGVDITPREAGAARSPAP